MTEQGKNDQTAREQIKAEALKLFAQKGFEAVSVREIAKESGHNISMVSYYFGGKEGLYKTILSDHVAETIEQIKRIFLHEAVTEVTEKSFRAEIRAMVELITNMKMNNPDMTKLMQRERVDGLPFAREVHEKLIDPVAEQVVEVFKEAQRKKIIRAGFEPAVFMGMLFESVLGFITSYECGLKTLKGSFELPRDKEKFINFVTDLFLEGIMK